MGAVISAERPASYQPITDALRRPVRAVALGSLQPGAPVPYVTADNAAAAVQFALDCPLDARRAVFNVVDLVDDLGRAGAAPVRADLDYAALQDAVRALAGLPALRRLPLPVAMVHCAARLLGRPHPEQWYSSAALRAAGFTAPGTLADEITRIVNGHIPDQARAGSAAGSLAAGGDVDLAPGGGTPCGC